MGKTGNLNIRKKKNNTNGSEDIKELQVEGFLLPAKTGFPKTTEKNLKVVRNCYLISRSFL